jgi:hypothetical protein
MEKAHNWDYIRSKTTSKTGKVKVKSSQKEPVQQPIKLINGVAATASTPSSSSGSVANTPHLASEQYPVGNMSVTLNSPQELSMPSTGQALMTPFDSPDFPMTMEFQPEFQDHFNFDWATAFAPTANVLYTPSLVDDRRLSHASSAANSTPNSNMLQGETSFDDAFNPLTPKDSPPFHTENGFKLESEYQAGPSNYISDQSLLFSPQFLVNEADPTFTTAPQMLAAQEFDLNNAMDLEMDMDVDDFDMSKYLPSISASNDDSLFPSTKDQFDEPLLFPMSNNNTKENPYADLFPELE